jgi:hypothetical protein
MVRSSVLCGLAAFLLAGFFGVRNVSSWPARIRYPGDGSYEGVALAETIHLRQGVPIYAAGAKDGFDAGTYGPLYYLTGEHLIDPASPSYFRLRLLSAFAILGCAAGCGVLGYWLTRRSLAAWLSPIVFLSYGMVSAQGTAALSDSTSLFLFLLGFLVAYRFRHGRNILFAVPLMVLGFYFKPQYVAGPLAVLAFLVLERRLRLALAFAALWVACGLGLFAVLQFVIFRGQAFWRHFLLYQAPLLSWEGFTHRTLFAFAIFLFLPLVFALEYLRTYPDKLISCYLFLATLLGLLTYSKDGSGLHYFFECVFALCVLVPALLAKRVAQRVYPIDVILVLGIMVFAGQWQTRRPPQKSDTAKYDAMQRFFRSHFPPHASALSLGPGDLLQAGLETPFSGFFQLEQLSQRGIVSDSELIAKIHARRFAVIVLNVDPTQEHDPYWLRIYTPMILAAIADGYKRDAILDIPAPEVIPGPETKGPQDRFYVYVPRAGLSGDQVF